MTQNEMVLDYLEKNKTITPQEAMNEFGIMRLGARIYELRKDGYDIGTQTTTSKNRYGRLVNYATYTYNGVKNDGQD